MKLERLFKKCVSLCIAQIMAVHCRKLRKHRQKKKKEALSWDPICYSTKSCLMCEEEQIQESIWTKVATNLSFLPCLRKLIFHTFFLYKKRNSTAYSPVEIICQIFPKWRGLFLGSWLMPLATAGVRWRLYQKPCVCFLSQTPNGLLLTPSPLLSSIHFWSSLSPVAPLSPARLQGPNTLFQVSIWKWTF